MFIIIGVPAGSLQQFPFLFPAVNKVLVIRPSVAWLRVQNCRLAVQNLQLLLF